MNVWEWAGSPEEVILKRLKEENGIRNGKILHTMGGKLFICTKCGFRNAKQRIWLKKRCKICAFDLSKVQVEVDPYVPYKKLSYDSWKCRKGHINSLKKWLCIEPNCMKNMESIK